MRMKVVGSELVTTAGCSAEEASSWVVVVVAAVCCECIQSPYQVWARSCWKDSGRPNPASGQEDL